MKVYELTIRIASAYIDISSEITSDQMAKSIQDYILEQLPDDVKSTDIAVEIPADISPILDTDTQEEG